MANKPVPGCCIRSNPEYACIVASATYGYGVYSWHIDKKEADYNASIVSGKVVPVDYYEGHLLTPPLAKAVINGMDFA